MFLLSAINLVKCSESSFTVKINIIKNNFSPKAGIVVNELSETFISIDKPLGGDIAMSKFFVM